MKILFLGTAEFACPSLEALLQSPHELIGVITQPDRPRGRGEKWMPTVTLFAALSYLDGKILSRTAEQHTQREWLSFLKVIDRETPLGLEIHLIMGNYATHKHPTVKSWLARRPRFHLHFTPTSSSWLNLVERFFRDLTEEVVREGSFGSVRELVGAMETYLAEWHLAPKRYVWKKKGEEILTKISRARAAQAPALSL